MRFKPVLFELKPFPFFRVLGQFNHQFFQIHGFHHTLFVVFHRKNPSRITRNSRHILELKVINNHGVVLLNAPGAQFVQDAAGFQHPLEVLQ